MGLDMYLTAQFPASEEITATWEALATPEQKTELENDGDCYISGWRWTGRNGMPDTVPSELYERLSMLTMPGHEGSPSISVVKVGNELRAEPKLFYWRKANAIHRWFVDTCQDGVDECQRTRIHSEQIADLVDRCEQISVAEGREQIALAEKLLPTQSGFFFGSLEIDEYYLAGVRETAVDLKARLALLFGRGAELYYQSSW